MQWATFLKKCARETENEGGERERERERQTEKEKERRENLERWESNNVEIWFQRIPSNYYEYKRQKEGDEGKGNLRDNRLRVARWKRRRREKQRKLKIHRAFNRFKHVYTWWLRDPLQLSPTMSFSFETNARTTRERGGWRLQFYAMSYSGKGTKYFFLKRRSETASPQHGATRRDAARRDEMRRDEVRRDKTKYTIVRSEVSRGLSTILEIPIRNRCTVATDIRGNQSLKTVYCNKLPFLRGNDLCDIWR